MSEQYQNLAILLVDDDPKLVAMYTRWLDRQDLRTANTKNDAQAHLNVGFVPDIVLVDYQLGDIAYGTEILLMIRKSCPHTLRVLMSGITDHIDTHDMTDLAHLIVSKTSPMMGDLLRNLGSGIIPDSLAAAWSHVTYTSVKACRERES